MVSCVFPGSFDPVTKGHVDLIKRASALFDHVLVTVMINSQKKETFPVGTRIHLLHSACSSFGNVSIESWDGLLADYMEKKKERIILRGLRNGLDLDYEMQSCVANRMLNGRIETVFLSADPALTGVSSSAVREIASFGGSIRAFVPECVAEEIETFLSKRIEKKIAGKGVFSDDQ